MIFKRYYSWTKHTLFERVQNNLFVSLIFKQYLLRAFFVLVLLYSISTRQSQKQRWGKWWPVQVPKLRKYRRGAKPGFLTPGPVLFSGHHNPFSFLMSDESIQFCSEKESYHSLGSLHLLNGMTELVLKVSLVNWRKLSSNIFAVSFGWQPTKERKIRCMSKRRKITKGQDFKTGVLLPKQWQHSNNVFWEFRVGEVAGGS